MSITTVALPFPDVVAIMRATKFSAEKHRNQRRRDRDASPYINHPIDLAHELMTTGGVGDAVTLCAALLHDTIEDTNTSREELLAIFGPEVLEVVLEVTDDKALPKAERKRLQVEHAPSKSPRAKLVKLADKICNVRDILTSPPTGWSAERCQQYVRWASQVVDGLRGTNTALEAAFDELVRRAEAGLLIPRQAS